MLYTLNFISTRYSLFIINDLCNKTWSLTRMMFMYMINVLFWKIDMKALLLCIVLPDTFWKAFLYIYSLILFKNAYIGKQFCTICLQCYRKRNKCSVMCVKRHNRCITDPCVMEEHMTSWVTDNSAFGLFCQIGKIITFIWFINSFQYFVFSGMILKMYWKETKE